MKNRIPGEVLREIFPRKLQRRTRKVGVSERFSQIEKIISGGQTGVDRAALDTALELGIPCGGWCPKGRKAEDGSIDARYPLRENSSTSYSARTEKNVRDSEGTLIIFWGKPTGGTALTITYAQKYRKPHLSIDLSQGGDPEAVMRWRQNNEITVLNVAGPRESEAPGIHDRAVDFLQKIFQKI